MARPAKSAAEKAITGAGRRPAAASSKQQSPLAHKARAFAPPAWLKGKDAREAWHRIVPELARITIMNDVFLDVVGRYCRHFGDWLKLTRQIDRQGATVLVRMTNSEEKMPRINPAIRVRHIVEKAMIEIEDRFAGSPLARLRINALQAANPGRGDLFDYAAGSKDESPGDPAAIPPPASVPSPVGFLQ